MSFCPKHSRMHYIWVQILNSQMPYISGPMEYGLFIFHQVYPNNDQIKLEVIPTRCRTKLAKKECKRKCYVPVRLHLILGAAGWLAQQHTT